MTKPPDKTTIYGADGKASRHPREQSPNTVTKCTLDTPAYVDRSTLATVTEAAPHHAAYRSHSSPAQSTTDVFSTPSTSVARSSLRSRTLPLVSVRPSAASDTSGTQKVCTDVFATPSKRSSPTLSPVVPTTRVLRTASVGDREVEALSSDEVQPPKSSIKEASQHGQPHLDCSGDFPQHRVPFAFSKVVTRFISTCVTEEASSLQSDSAMRPPLALLNASVKPLTPALLHVYLKSEATFRSLLTAYFIFSAMGTLLMHFFGVLWLIRRQLGGLNTLVSMAEGWGNVFAYQKVTSYVDAALCKVELDCGCSGGTSLCNATMYPSAEAAHNASCPFCEESQQRLISTFTQLCSVAYDPSVVYTKTYLVLLLLSVISSLVALCVAVYSCGAGVLASAGYATLSKQEEELEAQTVQEAGGLYSCTEKVRELHSSCTPTRTPSPLLHTFADKIPSPETPIAVAPSRERLMHTFEGLHAPSTALLPPLSVVIAEMSSSCGLVAPPGSTTN
ncbi:hypothetical protein, unknown function [Leishmania tarentolae]|uniref:Uncharacterized protein n=1 Tax=Leishmania tarentolae TaxID=5689 RepID=A0A640KS68_LEITA|nr:hypothetical protein, unknown function [Leishmania tarentolae]